MTYLHPHAMGMAAGRAEVAAERDTAVELLRRVVMDYVPDHCDESCACSAAVARRYLAQQVKPRPPRRPRADGRVAGDPMTYTDRSDAEDATFDALLQRLESAPAVSIARDVAQERQELAARLIDGMTRSDDQVRYLAAAFDAREYRALRLGRDGALLAETHLRGLAGDAKHVADLLPGGAGRTGLGNDVAQGVLGLGDDVAAEPETLVGGLAAVGEVVGKSDEGCGVVDVHVVKDDLTMSACQARLDGGVVSRDPDKCNGMCVMGNEVMPGQPAYQGHDADPRGGYYDWAAYPHPDCPRHGDAS